MEWARNQALEAMFIKIDFEKVYDRVEWPFILTMLKALGFGPYFIKAVETLFAEVSVSFYQSSHL
jgi:hypothetical protein